jgi:hypothetical protein
MPGCSITLPSPGVRYDRDNEAATRHAIQTAFLRCTGGEGGAGALPSRRTVVYTTGSLAAGESEQATFDLGAPGAVLRTIDTDRAARARFYAVASVQSTDADRAFTTPPQAGIGILGDFVWTTSHRKIVSPHLDLFNADSPVSNTVYVNVQNLTGSTSTVTITMTVVSVEV